MLKVWPFPSPFLRSWQVFVGVVKTLLCNLASHTSWFVLWLVVCFETGSNSRVSSTSLCSPGYNSVSVPSVLGLVLLVTTSSKGFIYWKASYISYIHIYVYLHIYYTYTHLCVIKGLFKASCGNGSWKEVREFGTYLAQINGLNKNSLTFWMFFFILLSPSVWPSLN